MSDAMVPARRRSAPLPAPDYADGDFDGAQSANVHALERPLAAVRRYKWLIAIVAVLAAAAGYVATRFVTPSYQARATVWIQFDNPQQEDARVGPIRSAELLGTSAAWIELFRSYRVVDEVVRKLALYLLPHDSADRPMFASFGLSERFLPGDYELVIDRGRKGWLLRTTSGVDVDRGSSADSIGRRVGFRWVLPYSAFDGGGEHVTRFSVTTPRETSIKLLGRLEHRLPVGSNFLWLTYQDPNPELAARTLNTWLEEFVRVAADLKKRNLVEFAAILDGQLRYAERATQEAEQAYQSFRVNTITLPTEAGPVAAGVEATRDPALESFFDQKIQFDNLRHDRESLERALAVAASGNTGYEGVLLIPSVAQSPGIQPLRNAFTQLYEAQARLRAERQSFTDEYPTVKQLIATVTTLERQTIPALANQMLAQLRERERDFSLRIAGQSRELQQIPPRTIEEMRLQRAVVVAEGLYTNLKNRYAEAKLAEASATADVSVLDTAVTPVEPTQDTARMTLLFAIVGGLGAAIGLALLLDRVDGKFRYAGQAVSELGLLVAGTVPRIPKGGINTRSPEQVVQFVESFRTLRMHVMHAAAGQKLAVAVTSPAPGDGKSLVAVNLAMSFAESGLRTVLIDADTRRGALHRAFSMEVAEGLTEYLQSSADAAHFIRATPHARLSLMTCGRRNQRSPELLTSARMQRLVESLGAQYDVVIFDTPPLAAGIDGYAISAAAGRVLLVLRLGKTERRLASAKLDVLNRLPVEITGAVLNGVDLTGEFQYYAYAAEYALTAPDDPEARVGAGR